MESKNSSKWLSAKELLKREVKELPKLWDPFIDQVANSILVGPSDCGKSTLLRQFAVAIVKGLDEFLGFRLNPVNKKVLYVSTEDDDSMIAFKLYKEFVRDLDNQELERLVFLFDVDDLMEALEEKLRKYGVDLIIVDNYLDTFKGNPNNAVDVRKHQQVYRNIAMRYKCSILFIHHLSKNGEMFAPNKNRVNGSQANEAKPRSVLELRLGVGTNERILSILKNNSMAEADKDEAFILEMNEFTLQFSNTGKTCERSSVGKTARRKHNESVWVPRMIKMRDGSGNSIEACRNLMASLHKDESVPSVTWFKTKLQEHGRSVEDYSTLLTDQNINSRLNHDESQKEAA